MGVHIARMGLSADTEGILLPEVIPETPAGDAGLTQGDIIQMMGGCHIRNTVELSKFLAAHPPGETVSFTALRDGKSVTGHLTLGTRPED